ncbi:MAG: Nramp family divalent metal transporter [bacterium]
MKKFKRIFKILGPGVITGAADDDPSGIATYSQTGAKYGFNLLWTALFMLPMMYVIQEMSARIGIVTGQGIAKNIKQHYSKYLLYFMVSLLVIANVINLGTDLGAMAAAAQLLVPMDTRFLLLSFTLIILFLEIFMPYRQYAKILKWLTLSLFAYILTGLFVQNDWGQLLIESITPKINFTYEYLFLIVGILGTTISPYMMFWQANEEVEEEIKGKLSMNKKGMPRINIKYIGKMRIDTFIGMLFSEVTTWFIIVTTAATLNKNGITDIQTAAQAAQALEPLVQTFPYSGEVARILFALGIIGTGLLAVPIFAGGASYAVCEVFNLNEGLNKKFTQARAFYLIILISTLVGLVINFIGINPMQALVYTAVLNGIISVPLIGMILLITNNKKIMGKYTNGKFTNIIGIITFSVMALAALGIFLTFFNK